MCRAWPNGNVHSRGRNHNGKDPRAVGEIPKPIHLQPGYSSLGYPAGTFPHAERACERVLSLPIFPGMTAEQLNYVASAVLEVVGKK
jgi:dTDP-4-amino-4,6-dideoxygalactose transaminase